MFTLGSSVVFFVQDFLKYLKVYDFSVILGILKYRGL